MRILLILMLLLATHGAAAAEPLRVITWNILAGDRGIRAVASTLQQLGGDVIALQEVDRKTRRSGRVDQVALLTDALQMHSAFCRHFRYDGGDFGLALLSRHPIRRWTCESVPGSNLRLLRATLGIAETSVDIVVVHFHTDDPRAADRVRRRNAAARLKEAQRALALTRPDKQPSIILGDFNDALDSQPSRLLAPSFTDACAAHGSLWEATWPAELPVVRIDHIWVSKHFNIRHCGAVPTRASDHRPVVAEVVRR